MMRFLQSNEVLCSSIQILPVTYWVYWVKARFCPESGLYCLCAEDFHWARRTSCVMNECLSNLFFQGLLGRYWGLHLLCSPWNQTQLWVRRTAQHVQTCISAFDFSRVTSIPWLNLQFSWWWMTIRGFWLREQNRETAQHIPQYNRHNDGCECSLAQHLM